MILTNEFLSRESVKRDISNASETRILNENYAVFSQKETYDLFISHSFFDKKLILTLIDLFNNADYSVYVDWINDKTLIVKAYLISLLEISLIQNGVHGSWD